VDIFVNFYDVMDFRTQLLLDKRRRDTKAETYFQNALRLQLD
jgi:hypothetical protein